jgi:hypothetical protein
MASAEFIDFFGLLVFLDKDYEMSALTHFYGIAKAKCFD